MKQLKILWNKILKDEKSFKIFQNNFILFSILLILYAYPYRPCIDLYRSVEGTIGDLKQGNIKSILPGKRTHKFSSYDVIYIDCQLENGNCLHLALSDSIPLSVGDKIRARYYTELLYKARYPISKYESRNEILYQVVELHQNNDCVVKYEKAIRGIFIWLIALMWTSIYIACFYYRQKRGFNVNKAQFQTHQDIIKDKYVKQFENWNFIVYEANEMAVIAIYFEDDHSSNYRYFKLKEEEKNSSQYDFCLLADEIRYDIGKYKNREIMVNQVE